ncbi:UNVERIFIED_CONTAM: hypothetical protein FKN15_076362 [Acipenser sinensis]
MADRSVLTRQESPVVVEEDTEGAHVVVEAAVDSIVAAPEVAEEGVAVASPEGVVVTEDTAAVDAMTEVGDTPPLTEAITRGIEHFTSPGVRYETAASASVRMIVHGAGRFGQFLQKSTDWLLVAFCPLPSPRLLLFSGLPCPPCFHANPSYLLVITCHELNDAARWLTIKA